MFKPEKQKNSALTLKDGEQCKGRSRKRSIKLRRLHLVQRCIQLTIAKDENISKTAVTFSVFDSRHGVIVIDYIFLSNRNRLNWPKMKCNRLHCQFNRNRRLISRLNLEIFPQHHSALNHGCGGWVSSFIIVCHGYVSGEAIFPSVWVKSR